MHVLLADHHDEQRGTLAANLRGAGYDVREVDWGFAAIDALRDGECRMVVIDDELPDLASNDLCRMIRAEDWNGYVYIVLLTNNTSSESIISGLQAGADEFVGKPVNTQELLARMRAGARVLSLETREIVIFALAKLAESRDIETARHLERVQIYSRLLSQKLALTPKYSSQIDAEFIRLVYQTSPLHDIGKVGIPDGVLLKPGRLSVQEYEVMKTHAQLGADTLDAALQRYPDARFLRIARDIAAAHHERYDGLGYPHGISGEDIPLCARIVALADVYDALTSKRIYKEAYSHEYARDVIFAESGKQFDPDVVDAFMVSEREFDHVRASLSGHPETQSALVKNVQQLERMTGSLSNIVNPA